jgi:Family of unknown function (DUF5686)/CarboxypepD_reg-like domain
VKIKLQIAISVLLLSCSAFAQTKIISGIVKDVHSEERIPFASVQFKGTGTGKLTDSAGQFTFHVSNYPSDTLEISCVGYELQKIAVNTQKDSVELFIFLQRATFKEAAVVRTKINKGLFLWRKIVANKSRNDKFRFDNFSYELYNKLELDLKNFKFDKFSKFKPLKSVSDLIRSNIDTTEKLPFLPTYLTEALSNYYYQKKPLRRREVIKAANTNGVKNESILKMLGGMDQNINVYSNFIPVFDKQYISPASDNGDNYYMYRVTDTQKVNNNRYYHLVFTPKRRGENTFEGDCWVHAGTFAIQKMNLRLGREANINFLENLSLIQEYKLLDDSTTWFLAKDKFVADISPLGKDRPGFIGRKTTTYKNIIVNDSSVEKELAKNKIQEETITVTGAAEKDKTYWSETRHEQLTKNEAAIIKMIDTLTNAPVFQRFTNTLNFIGTGYLNKGNYQLGPWFNWFTSNGWEGFRMRFDLGTNRKFDKHFWLHGYLAYGFGDKKFKGKGEIFYLPKKDPRTFFYTSYTDDLDFGQNYYGEVTTDNIFALAIRKPDIPIKFMKINEKRFEFFHETRSGFSTLLSVLHKGYTPLRNIPGKDSFTVTNGGSPLTTFETSIRFRYAYLEKFLENTFFRSSLGSPYPVADLFITKGTSGILKSSYNYTKISGSVADYIKIPPLGSIDLMVYGGRTFGTLPYVLLDVHPGNELYYYNKYAFNTMNRWEYISDKYAGINFEHNIGNGIFKLIPKLKLRQFWNIKTLWGSLSDANRALNFKAGNTFQTLDGKTFMEAGTGISNILRVFRLDFVWRVFPRPLPVQKSGRFGIYGSFRVGF